MNRKISSLIKLDIFVSIFCTLLGTAGLLVCSNISKINNFAAGFTLVGLAVVIYFAIIISSKWNWLDIRAVFSGVWIGTIGLAVFRLVAYQEEWELKTWVLLSAAYFSFQLGTNFGILTGDKIYNWLLNTSSKLNFKRVSFSFKNQRLFSICVITTVIGIITFVINVIIKGYIPCFSSDPHAYVNFYSRVQIFSVAATGVSGLCYYCIKTQPLTVFKKIILYLCMFYHTFLYPICIASRGIFLASAISVTVVVFYLNKKRFISLFLCVVVMFGVYIGCSYLRDYSDTQLLAFFEPKEIVVKTESENSESSVHEQTDDKHEQTDDKHEQTDDKHEQIDDKHEQIGDKHEQIGDKHEQIGDSQISTFSLPPKVAWVYSYLTVSHDNFNEAVQNTENFTWGARQFVPFNVIVRSSKIESIISNAENHFIREHLNTTNLIGDFYYDFSSVGVIVCMLLWAYLIGINQSITFKEKNWVALMLLGNTMVPIMLCFFESWFSIFSQWMLWGVVLIFAVTTSVKIKSKNKMLSK